MLISGDVEFLDACLRAPHACLRAPHLLNVVLLFQVVEAEASDELLGPRHILQGSKTSREGFPKLEAAGTRMGGRDARRVECIIT